MSTDPPDNPSVTTFAPLVEFARRHVRVHLRATTRQVCTRGYTLERRMLDQHNLIFIARGRAEWVLDQQPVPLNAGEFVLVPPHVWHHGRGLTKRLTLLSLHIVAMLPGGRDLFELLTPAQHQAVEPDSYLDRYLRAAVAEFDRPSEEDARLMLSTWTRLIVLEMLTDNARRGLLTARPADPIVTEVMDELNRRFNTPIRLDDLAAWTGFSPQHLNRRFRKQLGVTPLQYLAQLRMQRAAALLADGRLTIQAVAERVGYQDPYYFSRLFKQHLGQSPAQYRDAAAEPARSNPPSSRSSDPFPPRRRGR
ncbi:MAG: AraC family transcriptional regulator [Phycisphaeraceae bacterium]